MSESALAMRLLRARRKAAGVCIYCCDPLLTQTMCELHADLKRSSNAPIAMREKRRYPTERRSPRK